MARNIKKIAAVALITGLIFQDIPMSLLASTNEKTVERVITEFILPENIAEQQIEIGSLSNPNLPSELTVTITGESAVPMSIDNQEPEETFNNELEKDSKQIPKIEEEQIGGIAEEAASEELVEEPASEELVEEPEEEAVEKSAEETPEEPVEETEGAIEEEASEKVAFQWPFSITAQASEGADTVESTVAVNWTLQGDKEFSTAESAMFVYKAELVDKTLSLAPGVEVPEIIVNVSSVHKTRVEISPSTENGVITLYYQGVEYTNGDAFEVFQGEQIPGTLTPNIGYEYKLYSIRTTDYPSTVDANVEYKGNNQFVLNVPAMAVTVYADFIPIIPKITYNVPGEEGTTNLESVEESVTYGETVVVDNTGGSGAFDGNVVITEDTIITDPTKENHIFMGYEYSEIEGKKTLTATWEEDIIGEEGTGDGVPDKYQRVVTFSIANGSWSDGEIVEIVEVLTFVKDGKWTNDAEATAELNIPTGMKAGVGYTDGNWNENPVTPYAYGNGNKTYAYDFTEQHNVGYKGPVGEDSNDLRAENFIVKDGDVIHVDNNGGMGELAGDITVENDIEVPDPTKENHIFMGYEYSEVEGKKTLTAIWEEDIVGEEGTGDGVPDKYQRVVTFSIANGSWSDGKTVEIVELLTFVKDGKWTNDAEATVELKIPTGMKADADYTNGDWDVNPKTTYSYEDGNMTYVYDFEKIVISFETDGGIFPEGDDDKDNKIEVETEKGIVKESDIPKDPEKDGYEFDGWIDEEGNVVDPSKGPFTEHTTLKPKWDAVAPEVKVTIIEPTEVEGDSTTVIVGTTVTLLATITNNVKGELTYQWYDSEGNLIKGATNSTLDVDTSVSGLEDYYVMVTNKDRNASGETVASGTSNRVYIEVVNAPIVVEPTPEQPVPEQPRPTPEQPAPEQPALEPEQSGLASEQLEAETTEPTQTEPETKVRENVEFESEKEVLELDNHDEEVTSEVGDGDTPLAIRLFGGNEEHKWSLFNLVMTIMGCIIAITHILRRKDEDEEEKEEREQKNKYRLSRLLIGILFLVNLALLFFTQDFTARMWIFDEFSIIFGVVFFIQCLIAVFVIRKRVEEKEKLENEYEGV